MSGTSQRPRLQARSNEGARRTGPINPVAVFCDQFAGSRDYLGFISRTLLCFKSAFQIRAIFHDAPCWSLPRGHGWFALIFRRADEARWRQKEPKEFLS